MYKYNRQITISKDNHPNIRSLRAEIYKIVKSRYSDHRVNRLTIFFSIPFLHFGVNHGAQGEIRIKEREDAYFVTLKMTNGLIPLFLFVFFIVTIILTWNQDGSNGIWENLKNSSSFLLPFAFGLLLGWILFLASSSSRLGEIENEIN